jgi:hypothetical protein
MAVLELAVAVTAGCNCTISIDARHLLLCHSDLQSGSESIEGLGVCVIGFINTYDSQSYDTNGSPRKHMPVHSTKG